MALAAYGTPRAAGDLQELVLVENGQVRVNLAKYPAWRWSGAWAAYSDRFPRSSLGRLVRNAVTDWNSKQDFAASVQEWFSGSTLSVVAQGLEIARKLGLKVSGVGLSGGAALNCQANGRLLRELENRNISSLIVSPWSNDSGTAIGAAVAGALRDGVVVEERRSPLLGPVRLTRETCPDSAIRGAVNTLVAGGIIGLVSEGVEFGPRALGGRCLLADASRVGIRERLNIMKGRPSFMPFAPACTSEWARRNLKGSGSRNMAWTVPVSASALQSYPGIFHPSGETRAQIVSSSSAPLLHLLLAKFEECTGRAVLLSTSLNGSGEAIPSAIVDARDVSIRLGAHGLLSDSGWELFDGG